MRGVGGRIEGGEPFRKRAASGHRYLGGRKRRGGDGLELPLGALDVAGRERRIAVAAGGTGGKAGQGGEEQVAAHRSGDSMAVDLRQSV